MILTPRRQLGRERLLSPQIVQDGRAFRPGGADGEGLPTERLTLSPTSTWSGGSETKHVYLDRDLHCGKILYYDVQVPFWFHLSLSPVINETYTIAVNNFEAVNIRPRNLDHLIQGPFIPYMNYMLVTEVIHEKAVHGHWFNPLMGPAATCKYGYEWLSMYPESNAAMLQWLVITYTGIQRQVSYDFTDMDSDGFYWNSAWNEETGFDLPDHPLLYKTATEWQVRRLHGNCVNRVEGVYSEEPFEWPYPF